METDSVDAPYVQAVPEGITKEQALAELQHFMPDRVVRIEITTYGWIRIWRDQAKLTVRPTLREALGRVRWWYCGELGKSLPE